MIRLKRVHFHRTIKHQGIEYICQPCSNTFKTSREKESEGYRTIIMEIQNMRTKLPEQFLYVSSQIIRPTLQLV